MNNGINNHRIRQEFCSVLLITILMAAFAQAQTPTTATANDDRKNATRARVLMTRFVLAPSRFRLGPAPAARTTTGSGSNTNLIPMAGPNLQVFGSGILGRLTKWSGFTGSNSTIADSTIFEDKFGKVGIGTDSPASKLTVAGMIETTLAGLKFPDGTVQTTAGLASIVHDANLTGIGTSDSPLAVAVPLGLSGSTSITPILTVTNFGLGFALRGVSGSSGVPGVLGTSSDPGGLGVSGRSLTNIGVLGTANSGIAMWANSTTGIALRAISESGDEAVLVDVGDRAGRGGNAVIATGGRSFDDQGGAGVGAFGGASADADGGIGVGALGGTGSGPGNRGGIGINAFGGRGVNGATEGLAGNFGGDVTVTGNLSKGGGSFKIDHPLAPEHKYLYHSFVESPDMKNIYDGVIRLDAKGEAIVSMPEWFSALNRDFRYLVTAMGAPMPGLYIAEEMQDNSFRVAGGQPGMKVSWQVTGIRQDAYANKNRIKVEEDKPERERGFYLHPQVFNQPEERGIEWARNPETMQRMKENRLKHIEELKQNAQSNDR